MRVTHLWRYPVKSMRGERLSTARFERGGIPFDRRFALLDDGVAPTRRGKPATARQHPGLLAYAPTVTGGGVVVSAPDGTVMQVTQDDLIGRLATESGLRLALSDEPSGTNHDAADVLVINEASVRLLENEWGRPVDIRRFRANVAVDEVHPFEEEAWIGRRLRVGSALLEVVSSCERCFITTVDPETLAVDPSFLRLMAQRHRACFGVYCAVAEPGNADIGSECALLPTEAIPTRRHE